MNPVIEGARGLAALMVLLHHFSYSLPAGVAGSLAWIHFFHNGVDLFFVLTGFLFAPYLLGTERMAPGAFAIRRAFRLYPLYVVSLLASVLLADAQPGMAEAFVKHLFFIQALPVFPASDAAYFSLVYWTLPVEVGFYILVALSLRWASGAAGLAPGARLAAMAAIAVACYGMCYGWHPDMKAERWIVWQAQLPALLIEFWFGVALAYAMPSLERSKPWRWGVLAAGIALLGVLLAWYPQAVTEGLPPRPFGYFNVASALAFALLLGGAMSIHSERPRRAGIGQRLALLGGALSYGIYLFHGKGIALAEMAGPAWPAFAKIPVAFALTVALAWALHFTVELPLRSLGRRITARPAAA